jgi:aconitate hydratase
MGAKLYLSSPEVAVASALAGALTDPRTLGDPPALAVPDSFPTMEHLFLQPSDAPETVDIIRGPNIKPLPEATPMSERLTGEVLIHLDDDVTTDDIMPAGAHILSLRSNLPAISKFVFSNMHPDFANMAIEKGGGFIVAGKNYGQGSSREHAALAPMALGIRGVLAMSFARIHRSNLINFGILPMTFCRAQDYETISAGDRLVIRNAATLVKDGKKTLQVSNETKDISFDVALDLDTAERAVVASGGRLKHFRQSQS